MPAERIVTPEAWEFVKALVSRTDLAETAADAFRRAYPDAPPHMIEAAVFHVFGDGVAAALDWVAAAEKFLRDPSRDFDCGATWHLLYHLYNWQQFQALLPVGRAGLLERLQDVHLFIKENDLQAATRVVKQLEEIIGGDVQPPRID